MCPLTNFANIPYIERFFDCFRHVMYCYGIKSSTFTKLGDFSIKYRNFSKFSAPAAPKMCHLTQFFPKNFQKFQFFGAFGAEKCVTERQNWPPFWPLAPPIASLPPTHPQDKWTMEWNSKHNDFNLGFNSVL